MNPRRDALVQNVPESFKPLVNALLDYVEQRIENYKQEQVGERQYIQRRSEGNTKRIHELAEEVANISLRLHKIEDHFEHTGIVQELTEGMFAIASRLEQYIDQQQRNERSRHISQEHRDDRADSSSSPGSDTAAG